MPKPTETPTKINDYLVLPIRLPGSNAAPATHYVYLRRHEPKIPTAIDSNSLFAVNVPVDTTEAHLRGLFSKIGGGRVERVIFGGEESKEDVSDATTDSRKRKRGSDATENAAVKTWDRDMRRSGATAVVVFVDKASCEMSFKAVTKATKSGKKSGNGEGVVAWGDGLPKENKIPNLGISRMAFNFVYIRSVERVLTSFFLTFLGYLTHHNLRFPDKALLQKSVDAYMEVFAEKEAEGQRALARRRLEPDEDGFVTVVRGGRKAPARQEEAAAVAEQKKGKSELKDFYRFQVREVRKERHQQLLAKFEQDKRKVAERKNQRKFKV